MTEKRKLWPRVTALVVSLSIVSAMLLYVGDAMGVGPNLGVPFGYYGRVNQIVSRIEANPELEVVRVDLHRDCTLEDFYITVRTETDGDVRLQFENADERPFDELLRELKKVGM